LHRSYLSVLARYDRKANGKISEPPDRSNSLSREKKRDPKPSSQVGLGLARSTARLQVSRLDSFLPEPEIPVPLEILDSFQTAHVFVAGVEVHAVVTGCRVDESVGEVEIVFETEVGCFKA
jgi:hypothetical protein